MEIDFIGIDWYAPLSDWRDGTAHLDALSGTNSIHDRDYLKSNVEGGEGYDWYYASSADRDAQLRTPITDGAYAEPWVYRYKDLRSWWSEPHHDRIAGVRQTSPTGWVPQSKPVRLVELGCPAVDKGANQPNVFIDPKSSESTPPYHSTGARDDLIQRRYIEALLAYWQGASNPVSSVYAGPMLDLAHSHVWTWDARPFPEFPTRDDVWSDGTNWRLGHWLTGRAGQSSVGEIVGDIAAQVGLDDLDTTKLEGVLAGYVINAGARARDEIERLGAVFGFDIVDRASGPVCVPHLKDSAPVMVPAQSLTVRDNGPGLSFGQEAKDTHPTEVRLQFAADDGDYRPASVSALGLEHEIEGVIQMALNGLADRDLATRWARGALSRMQAETRTAALSLPPSFGALEAGDCISLDAGPDGAVWCLASAEGTETRDCELVGTRGGLNVTTGPQPEGSAAPRPPSRPVLILLDLPLRAGEPARNGFLAAGWSDPWPGKLTLHAGSDPDALTARAEITAPAFTGQLEADLGSGQEGRWDKANAVKVRLKNGAFSNATQTRVLNGANLIAVATAQAWEVLSFTNAQLEPDGSWTLTGLVRGLGGTPVSGAGVGAKVVLLDEACVTLPVHDHEVGTDLTVVAVPPGKPINDVSVRTVSARYDSAEYRPLSPVHVEAALSGADLQVSWIRRARVDADAWAYGDVALDEAREAYQVVWFDGEVEVSRSEVDAPAITLTAAQLATLYTSGLSAAAVEVAQISDRFGPGAVARCDLSGLS